MSSENLWLSAGGIEVNEFAKFRLMWETKFDNGLLVATIEIALPKYIVKLPFWKLIFL